MQYVALLIMFVATFLLGYHFRTLTMRIVEVEEAVKTKADKQKPVEPEEPPSGIIDPYDEIQTAIYEAKKEQDRLNGII